MESYLCPLCGRRFDYFWMHDRWRCSRVTQIADKNLVRLYQRHERVTFALRRRHEGATMEEIGIDLGVTRAAVSAMLKTRKKLVSQINETRQVEPMSWLEVRHLKHSSTQSRCVLDALAAV